MVKKIKRRRSRTCFACFGRGKGFIKSSILGKPVNRVDWIKLEWYNSKGEGSQICMTDREALVMSAALIHAIGNRGKLR